MYVFLDDERLPEDVTWVGLPKVEWTVVRTFLEFEEVILNNDVDVVSFDHDIQCFTNEKEHTGYDCLKLLVLTCLSENIPIPSCYFHTQNPIGKKNMQTYYESAVKFQGDNK